MRRVAVALAVSMVAAAVPGVAAAMPPTTFNPVVEAQNFSITQQRQAIYDTPQYQTAAGGRSASRTPPTRSPSRPPTRGGSSPTTCAGTRATAAPATSVSTTGAAAGYGIVRPVLFTARDGATLSGHVWATVAGPAKRPGIVITNGSVQADEQMYWYAAQTLAKDGYVVLTFDPQGQGQSDTYGQSPDQNEGVPAQSDGRPFYDGTEDAINFLLSTPAAPLRAGHQLQHRHQPRGQAERSASPRASTPPTTRSGSCSTPPRSAWPATPTARPASPTSASGTRGSRPSWPGTTSAARHRPRRSPAARAARQRRSASSPARPIRPPATTVPITKPALGMSADYFLPPTPNTSLPDPSAKSQESYAYSKAGVDTGEIIIRGGIAPRLQLDPQPGLRRLAARARHHRLVHERLV